MVSQKKKDLLLLCTYLVGIVLLNFLSGFFFTRFDFTREKRYTLSPITTRQISRLDDQLEVTVYLEGNFPAGFKKLQAATRDLLNDYRSYSNGKLSIKFVDPLQGDQKQQEVFYDELLSKGIEPTQIGVQKDGGVSQILLYPAALLRYKGRELPVKLSPYTSGNITQTAINHAIENLEYAFTTGIRQVMADGKPLVAFSEGHGELSDLQLYDAMHSLQDGYEVRRVDLRQITFAGLDKMKVLVVPKPQNAFSEAEKFKINYFVRRGGRVFWAIDQVTAELDSLRGKGQELVYAKELNLDDLLFKYGVRVNKELVADMVCGQIPVTVGMSNGQPQMELMPWLYYPILVPSSTHPMVRNLDGIRTEFAATIDTLAIAGINKEIVLSSSAFSRVLRAPAVISLAMIRQEADPSAFRNVPLPMGVLLEGIFPSLFLNRPVPAGISGLPSGPERVRPGKMLVVADGDVLKNQVSATDGSPFPLGYDRYQQKQYGNRNFLLNAIDYLSDDSGVLSLRTKEIQVRLLDRPRIRSEKLFWQVLNIGLPLVVLVIAGIFQHYFRKRKYG